MTCRSSLIQMNTRYNKVLSLCLRMLTEEHFHFNQTAYEAVKVDGELKIGVATHNGLQHGTVDMETCDRNTTATCHRFLYTYRISVITVDYCRSCGRIVLERCQIYGIIMAELCYTASPMFVFFFLWQMIVIYVHG